MSVSREEAVKEKKKRKFKLFGRLKQKDKKFQVKQGKY